MTFAEKKTRHSTQFFSVLLGIQQAVGGQSVLAVSYVGTQNRHQNYYTEIDLPPQSLLPGFVTSSALAQTYNGSVPYIGYNSVLMAQDEANGDYNAIQISLRGTTLKNALTYQIAYTYSHTNDSFDGITESDGDLYNVSNPYQEWKYDYGSSAFDIRNNFFANFVYQVPLLKNSGNRMMKTILGGWAVSGIVIAISGAPLNIGLNGQNVASIAPNTANRPNVSGRWSILTRSRNGSTPLSFLCQHLGTGVTNPTTVCGAQVVITGTFPCSRTFS
jgi:hypothetical protein